MPFNASGFFQRLFTFTTDRDNGTKIRADRMDAEFDNVKAAIDDITGDNYIHRGSIKAAQGLPANLSYTFNNDDDTGFYRPASDAISVQTGGAERARFTDAGLSVGGSRVLTQADEGAGKGLDADTLDGQEGAFYQNAANLNAGTISNARLPAVISSDITGNAATLGGKASAFYRNATNLNAGTISDAHLPAVISSDITGNADTATHADNADTLDGQHGAFYQNAGNLNAGRVPAARLSGTYNMSITGSASQLANVIATNYARTDVNEIFHGHVSVSRTSSDAQLRIGQNNNGNPYIELFRGSARRGFIQAIVDRLRIVVENGGTDHRLDLLNDGRIFWVNSPLAGFSTTSDKNATSFPVGQTLLAYNEKRGSATRRVSVSVYHLGVNNVSYSLSTLGYSGAQRLSGVWRSCGQSDNNLQVQRVG